MFLRKEKASMFKTSFVLSFAILISLSCVAGATATHRYSFNDGTANDSIGNASGTLMNGASVTGGKVVLNNDGVSTDATVGQYLSLPQNILPTRNFTLEVWFTFNGGNPWQRILDLGSKDPTDNTIGKGFIILTENGAGGVLGQVSINSWGDPQDTDYVSGGQFPAGAEHCLAYVHNLDGSAENLYLDGAPIGSGAAHVDPSTANYSNFWLGRSQFASDPFFNGSIDELRTYDNPLTAAQIQSSYNAGPDAAVPEPSALALLGAGAIGLAGWACRHRNRVK
jgi:hypothetical protein